MKSLAHLVLAIAVLGSLALRSLPDIPSTYTVTTALDNDADGCGEPPFDQCTLREALDAANAHLGYKDVIEFDISGGSFQTISLIGARLPRIDDPVHIDGYSQPGASVATEGGVAQLMIELNGSSLPISQANAGLILASSGSTIEGLSIYGFPSNAIVIDGSLWATADDNIVQGNHLGVNWNATTSPFNNSLNGIYIGRGASDNVIGGDEPSERNVISGNYWSGIEIHAAGTTGNTVSGNRIGTNGAASAAIPNEMHGVRIYGGATGNTVGGDTTTERNVISGNMLCGVMIYGVAQPTASNTVSGNYIGLNIIGGLAIPNGDSGVCITDSASNTIGGDTVGERNVISGNLDHGVYITGSLATMNVVTGNYIGLKYDGVIPNPNTSRGVAIENGAHANTIGGTATAEGNVISGNGASGLRIDDSGTDDNSILGNLIGTDATGTVAVPNGMHGIEVYGGDNTTIGGDSAGAGNVISGNVNFGVTISGTDVSNVTVAGNLVGVDVTGLATMPNGSGGVGASSGASNVVIGGDLLAEGNVISGNDGSGVDIREDTTTTVTIRGNWIGSDRTSTHSLPNARHGVYFADSASGHTVGPDNVITNNLWDGVSISSATSNAITITRNRIFANGLDEIYLNASANNGIDPPLISSTTLGSVEIAGTACASCTVEVFGANTAYIGAERYLGTTLASAGGAWALTLPSLAYSHLTATATDSLGNTSELALDFTATVRSLFLPLILHQFP
ncbi:MAG: hypothetical protein A2Z30_04160 [Chloroflexi bacterium RBG_16_64_43]|nr:MAG: hypothetical protein A2Z30_04160 [Chloroflexi bacterium RBG_16_64_43]